MVPEQSIVPKINEHLPPEIRVIGEFNMKLRCYERLKSVQKRVFLTAFFKNREQMVEQVVKYFSRKIHSRCRNLHIVTGSV